MGKTTGIALMAALLLLPAALSGQAPNSASQNLDSSRDTDIAIQSADTAAAGLRSCVGSYTDQTVPGSVTLNGCSTLDIRNVTVNNGGILSIAIGGSMTVNGPFEVKPGGAFNAGIIEPEEDLPSVFNYTYDNAGNRISRTLARTASTHSTAAPSENMQKKDETTPKEQ